LPSAQGFTFIGSGAAEGQIFSVNGTTLTLNSQGLNSSFSDTIDASPGALQAATTNVTGAYLLNGGYKPNMDTTISIRMKVYPGTTASSNIFQMRAGSVLFDFGFSDSGIRINGSLNVSIATADGFHDYKIVLPGGTGTYQFYCDGVLKSSGAAISGNFGSGFLVFGDQDINGSGKADFTRIDYTSPTTLQKTYLPIIIKSSPPPQ